MTKAEQKILTWFAKLKPNSGSITYSLGRAEARAVRDFLRSRRPRSDETTYWLDYFKFYWADKRFDEKSEFGGKSVPLDDYDDGVRFGVYCRTLLALEGVIIP